jgi:hypothetical protein
LNKNNVHVGGFLASAVTELDKLKFVRTPRIIPHKNGKDALEE